MATIADVTRIAGVSVSTTWQVLNGTRRVAPDPAAPVEAAIESFGDRLNITVRSPKAASTRSVGTAVSSISNPYFGDVVCSIDLDAAIVECESCGRPK